jgi:type IV pilus assembly protein PilY1
MTTRPIAPRPPTTRPPRRCAPCRQLLATGLCRLCALVSMPSRAELTIGNNPLYLVMGKANVLVVLDNSNSMDEDASGAAVGSNVPNSKIRGRARRGAQPDRHLPQPRQHGPDGVPAEHAQVLAAAQLALRRQLRPGQLRPGLDRRARQRRRTSATAWPTRPRPGLHPLQRGAAVLFHQQLQQRVLLFTRRRREQQLQRGENPSTGPWDNYRCFRTKTGTSDTLPTWGNATSEAAAGYTATGSQAQFFPTDSDYAQGILDFRPHDLELGGHHLVAQRFTRPRLPARAAEGSWTAPRPAASRPSWPATCRRPGALHHHGIKNAGLTPIEGTLLTAKDYYGGAWNNAAEGYTPVATRCPSPAARTSWCC